MNTMTDTALAERSVLGGMLLSKAAVWEVIDTLKPDDFGDWKHETVFRAIVDQAHAGRPTDVVAVTTALVESGEAKRFDISELHDFTSEVPTASNAAYYARIVRDASLKRRLTEAGLQVTNLGQQAEGDVLGAVEQARAIVDAVAGQIGFEASPVGDSIDDVIASLAEAPEFTPTPWIALNGLIDGLRPGGLYTVAARPGEGKTIMGMMLANQMCAKGAVAFSSLEMGRDQLIMRMIASRAAVHMSHLAQRDLNPGEWDRVAKQRDLIRRIPLFIDDRPAVTVAQVRAHARSVARRAPLAAIVVDYVQLMTSPLPPTTPRHIVVGGITAMLKVTAKELGVPIVMLAQFGRGTEQGGLIRRAPMLADLRESGSIEQDSDVVLGLQRVQHPETGEFENELDVHVLKNRHGSIGKANLRWEGAFARLTSQPWDVNPG